MLGQVRGENLNEERSQLAGVVRKAPGGSTNLCGRGLTVEDTWTSENSGSLEPTGGKDASWKETWTSREGTSCARVESLVFFLDNRVSKNTFTRDNVVSGMDRYRIHVGTRVSQVAQW